MTPSSVTGKHTYTEKSFDQNKTTWGWGVGGGYITITLDVAPNVTVTLNPTFHFGGRSTSPKVQCSIMKMNPIFFSWGGEGAEGYIVQPVHLS